ncbi:MAG TPA: AAA family ATPase [Longimicrobium sp.]|nr:AAA family ATPase [Longimicrobium sp.]
MTPTKSDLLLRTIEVEGYRGIGRLQLPRLGRVNLVVGENNAGKTSFLEAVQLYATRTPRTVLASILRERTDFRPRFRPAAYDEVTPEQVSAVVESVRSLFYGSFSGLVGNAIRVAATDDPGPALVISLPWATSTTGEETGGELLELFLGPESPLVHIERGGKLTELSLDWFLKRFGIMLTGTSQSTAFVPAQGFDRARLAEMWDQAASAGYAPQVEEALRAVIPALERVYLLGEPASGGRSVALQLSDTVRPVPLTSMGDGTNRVFGLALACVRSRGGVLLVDEVENGLHHTVQLEVWECLFKLAEELNVQVFATTHSWEAVVGFQHAANRSPAEGMLYRLERQPDGNIDPVAFTEADVAIAARHDVEIR